MNMPVSKFPVKMESRSHFGGGGGFVYNSGVVLAVCLSVPACVWDAGLEPACVQLPFLSRCR